MITIRQYRNEGYEIDITIRWPDGSRHRERRKSPVTGKAASRRWAQDREAALLRAGKPALALVDEPKEVPTVEEFGPRFISGYAEANQQKASGIASKRRILRIHLVPGLGRKKLDEIDNEIVQQLKLKLAEREPKTVNNILSTLNKMLKVAVEWRVIDEMPCTIRLLKVSSPEMRFYEQDQYSQLVDAARSLDHRKMIAVLLGGDAGLRRGEIIALRQTDIDHRRRQIRVERADWNGIEDLPKGGRGRVVPMTVALAKALGEHRHSRGPRVLYQEDGGEVTANTLQDWMEQVTAQAGLERTRSLHILRHTFCSHLAMEGAPPKAIQELAGHRHLSTTMRYMHLTPAARESAIQLLDKARKSEKNEARGDGVETADSQQANSKASA